MSLTLSSESTGGGDIDEANGSALYPLSDDEDSSIVADLIAMFPTLDHEVIVTVLQAHEGRLQATVDYLMSTNSGEEPGRGENSNHSARNGYLDPAHDLIGQFSEDIGGLPELLPRYLCDREDEWEDKDRNSIDDKDDVEQDYSTPGQAHRSFDPEDDPLPTYMEACSELPHSSVSIPGVACSSTANPSCSIEGRAECSGVSIVGEHKKSRSLGI